MLSPRSGREFLCRPAWITCRLVFRMTVAWLQTPFKTHNLVPNLPQGFHANDSIPQFMRVSSPKDIVVASRKVAISVTSDGSGSLSYQVTANPVFREVRLLRSIQRSASYARASLLRCDRLPPSCPWKNSYRTPIHAPNLPPFHCPALFCLPLSFSSSFLAAPYFSSHCPIANMASKPPR